MSARHTVLAVGLLLALVAAPAAAAPVVAQFSKAQGKEVVQRDPGLVARHPAVAPHVHAFRRALAARAFNAPEYTAMFKYEVSVYGGRGPLAPYVAWLDVNRVLGTMGQQLPAKGELVYVSGGCEPRSKHSFDLLVAGQSEAIYVFSADSQALAYVRSHTHVGLVGRYLGDGGLELVRFTPH